MEIENTAIRLKKIMQERNLRQVDLLEMVKPFCEKYNVKINKSDISQYLSGKVKPGQEKLSMLGMALGVTESWLMGYDSPKEKSHYIETLTLSKEETTLLENYNKLDTDDKSKVIDYTKLLSNQDKYKDLDNTADEITATKEDDEFTKVLEARKRVEQYFKENPHLMPIASHDKEGEFTEEDYKHDMDIMTNDDLWK